MIEFVVPGKPIPQERRVHTTKGWDFDPPKSRKAKRIIRQYAMAARPLPILKPSERDFAVYVDFHGPHWGADLDNLVKLVMDAIKGIFWIDDHQVVELAARKYRVEKGKEKTIIEIEELKPEALEDLP